MKNNRLVFSGRGDAYLEWAQHTAYRHLAAHQRVGLIAQIRQDGEDASYLTTLIKRSKNGLDSKQLKNYSRFELASPIKSNPIEGTLLDFKGRREWQVVLGIIDDGFPVAQAAHLNRVVVFSRPSNGGQGGVLFSGALKKAHRDNGNNDSATYASLGLLNLRYRATHGAHVLDLFAGPMPARSRVSPSRMAGEGHDGSAHLPPTWDQPDDKASKAPIVLVQPPGEAIDDPTGRWLGKHVLDGVDFILHAASQLRRAAGGQGTTTHGSSSLPDSANPTTHPELTAVRESAVNAQLQHVVINVSWGPQTGPHDGTSLLEKALLQRVRSALSDGQRLDIVLPAGNSFEARAHAQFPAKDGCANLEWHVMPDADHPQFLEVWWPTGTAIEDARITVQAPDGLELSNIGSNDGQGAGSGGHGVFGQCDDPWHLVVVPHPGPAHPSLRQMAMLALGPTRAGSPSGCAARPAQHGSWRINVKRVTASSSTGDVHVYIARNTANMGARRRSKDGYLHDPDYEANRQGRAPGRPVEDNSVVRRKGTLNGIGTALAGQGCMVIGGHVLNKVPGPGQTPGSGLPADYSSSGPGDSGGREAPDNSLPTDESVYLRGIRGGAVREGTSIRLIGTSTAAPQLARKLVNGAWPPAPPPSRTAPPKREEAPPPSQPEFETAPDPRLGNGPLPMKLGNPPT